MNIISVIIPAYNSAIYLPRALESVINQTYKNIEIIIAVDAASTDSTLDVSKSFAKKHNNVKVIELPTLKNATKSRKIALNYASGDFIAFLDADDYIVPSMYETMLNSLLANKADAVECAYYHIFSSGYSKVVSINNEGFLSKPNLIARSLDGVLWKFLFKRQILDTIILDENLTLGEDCEFCFRLAISNYKIFYIKEPLYYYFQNPTSLSKGSGYDKAVLIFPYINKMLKNLKLIKDKTSTLEINSGLLHAGIYWFAKISGIVDSYYFYTQLAKCDFNEIYFFEKNLKTIRYLKQSNLIGFFLFYFQHKRMLSIRIKPKVNEYRIIILGYIISI